MDYLWTPWRYAYVSAAEKAAGCVFCDAVKAGDDAKTRIVYRGQHCFVILNTFPYTPGHVMIVPYAHLDELQKLPPEAASEMMSLSQRMESVLRDLYHPGGINIMLGDGSVRFIKDTVALSVWRALSTRNGGEVVSGSDY